MTDEERIDFWSEARAPRNTKESGITDGSDPDGVRSLFQQDYDRLLFSTPVRRLADKTQVWPMDDNDGVRTRLTHSHEVSNLARSIGTRAHKQAASRFGSTDLHKVIQPILSAIGLGDDLGNPPFGHQGETAIGNWFEKRKDWIFSYKNQQRRRKLSEPIPRGIWDEFIKFDGNPQTLRLLTRLQTHQDKVGLDLTAATLAASLKYSVSYNNRDKKISAKKKGGYFESEKNIVEWIRSKTGLTEGQRHPLTWIMEAADDIAYSVLDVDDLLKKAVLSPDDVLVILRHDSSLSECVGVKLLSKKYESINQSDRHADIVKDIKIQYFRAYMIEALINEASVGFIKNAEKIFELHHSMGLMEKSSLCNALKGVAKRYGFSHRSVLRTEAEGAAAIDDIMSYLWEAISDREADNLRSNRKNARARYVFTMISPNYIEAAEDTSSLTRSAAGLRYRELRLLTDMVSGMTDTFALKLWKDIRALPNANCP
ncbi:MAG: deoxyguanosinetriphosphate triphosphohydrolase family protein [Rhodospirillaceae bacterium]